MNTIEFTFDAWQIVQVVVAVILPVVVGLVTKLNASGGLKAVLLAALSLATSIGTEALAAHNAGQSYDLGQALVLGLGTFVIAVATHYGLWKPTGAATAVGSVGSSRTDEDPPESDAERADPDDFPEGDIADLPDEDDSPEVTETDATPPAPRWSPQH